MNDSSILFDVLTPLGFRVRCHESYWNGKIINSHPIMAGRIADVKRTLSDPAEVRLSRTDHEVHRFYAPAKSDWYVWLSGHPAATDSSLQPIQPTK